MEVFRLGHRILPIVKALFEVVDIIIIIFFFGASCVHVAFSLSHPNSGNGYEDGQCVGV